MLIFRTICNRMLLKLGLKFDVGILCDNNIYS